MLSCLFMGTLVNQGLIASEKPNVLLICVDDLKPVMGCYGDKLAKTPNMDRLAARGVRFDSAYCNQAVCSPSRNALLTGYRSQTLGIYDLETHFRKVMPDVVTLPQHFQKHGYRTEAVGKIFHVGHGNIDDAKSWSVPHWPAKGKTMYHLPSNRPNSKDKAADSAAKGHAWESAKVEDDEYVDHEIANVAIAQLRNAKTDKTPLFLAAGFIRPHLPFVAPKKYWDLYDANSFKLPELRRAPMDAPSYALAPGGELRPYKGIPKSGVLPDDTQLKLIHGYYAAMSYMDAQLGRVLDALDETGLASKTIIVLWGDHGWHLGDHGQWCKHSNYEQATRIPLIVVAPGVKPGATKALVESVDIFPTLAALADLPKIDRDGMSFLEVLRDPKAEIKDAVSHVYPRGKKLGRAIRTERYRLVEWKVIGEKPETADLELYDYQSDPAETKNLAKEQPTVVKLLLSKLYQQPEAIPQSVSK
jgi:iduronate 2-sulfatase